MFSFNGGLSDETRMVPGLVMHPQAMHTLELNRISFCTRLGLVIFKGLRHHLLRFARDACTVRRADKTLGVNLVNVFGP